MGHWFIVQTNPQAERKADGELRRAGLRVYLPKRSYEAKDRKYHGEPKVKWRPLLIGYLFIRFPDYLTDRYGNPQFGIIRGCQGVRDYVKAANAMGEWEPFGIKDELVAAFMRRQRQREFGRPAVVDRKKRLAAMRERFSPGNKHRIAAGPFASFLATLEKLNDNLTIEAEIDVFGRPVRFKLPVEDISPEPEIIVDDQAEAA